MRRAILVILSVAAFGSLSTISTNAMPIAPSVAPISSVEQIHLVCNEWGRCWRQPDYYRPYAYDRRHDDDEWRDRDRDRHWGYYDRPDYQGGYGRWHRHREDDDEQ
jgi:hypothetical protein